ncbi:hypothetical protein FE783_13515 [Paenibacillus mesophilus]|uniref:RCC1 domain-containing protein n=1 Tax=Paenibacillus mesophilus TaxID=2582849 RepID=UPI00110E0722|nr:hypothetical protein [Paenibacillus mesophilus]TMV49518.1 hypothetical protein FE783_13515 [Paenibacillus mesophilus]
MWKRKVGLVAIAGLIAFSHSAYASESEESKEGEVKRKAVAGYQYSIQVEADGTVWSFGRLPGGGSSSQVGRVKGGALERIAQVSGGYAHAAAVDADGRVWAWGDNETGQLGQRDNEKYGAAVQVDFEAGDRIKAVAAGYDHTLALSENGKVWAWGSNRYSQLGDGTETDRSKPIRVMAGLKPLDDVVAIAAGFGLSYALNEDGEVWTWGSQGKREGDMQQVMLDQGGKLVPLGEIVSIAAGYDHALALDRYGKLYAWGSNRSGQLGIGAGGDSTYSLHAVELTGLPTLTAAAAGDRTSVALDKEGDIWVWGASYPYDAGGKPTEPDRFAPIRLTDDGDFSTVSVGRDHGMAIDDKEQVWVWGENDYYQLGHAYNSFSTGKPVVQKTIERTRASAYRSAVKVEEAAVVGKERVLKLSLRLKDADGKTLLGKWPTAELKIPWIDPIVVPFKPAEDASYKTEIGIPYPYYLIDQKIQIRVDGETIAEITGGSGESLK